MTGRVVGLDLSLTATGIAAASGTLHTITSKPDDGTIAGRLNRMADIEQAICRHLDDLRLVVIEGPAFSSGAVPGSHLRAGLWWEVVRTVVLHYAPVAEVTPTTLKKFATGRGNATKADMRVAMLQRAGLDVRDDNQVDAWWLRQAGLHHLGSPEAVSVPKAQTEALAKVRWP